MILFYSLFNVVFYWFICVKLILTKDTTSLTNDSSNHEYLSLSGESVESFASRQPVANVHRPRNSSLTENRVIPTNSTPVSADPPVEQVQRSGSYIDSLFMADSLTPTVTNEEIVSIQPQVNNRSESVDEPTRNALRTRHTIATRDRQAYSILSSCSGKYNE